RRLGAVLGGGHGLGRGQLLAGGGRRLGGRLALTALAGLAGLAAAAAPAAAAAAALAAVAVAIAPLLAVAALLAARLARLVGLFLLVLFLALVVDLVDRLLFPDGRRRRGEARALGRRRAVRFDAHPRAFEAFVDHDLDGDAVARLDLADLGALLVEQVDRRLAPGAQHDPRAAAAARLVLEHTERGQAGRR